MVLIEIKLLPVFCAEILALSTTAIVWSAG